MKMKLLIIRIITFPVKLSIMLLWHILIATLLSIKWLIIGEDEFFRDTDFTENISELINFKK